MKKLGMIALLFLAGCAGPDVNGYRPTLAKQPNDKAQYEKDLGDCKYAVLHPPASSITPAFGVLGAVLGGAASHANANRDEVIMYDDWTPFGERVDACMRFKGYKIKSEKMQ